MSPLRGEVGIEPIRGTRAQEQATGDQKRAAQLVVCRHATNTDDARLLLDVLGLLPESKRVRARSAARGEREGPQ